MDDQFEDKRSLDDFIRYFEVLIRRRYLIVTIFFSIMIVTVIYLLVVIPKYMVSTTILPPQETSSIGGINQLATKALGLGSFGNQNIPELYREILMSRPVIKNVLLREFRSDSKGISRPLIDLLEIKEESLSKRIGIGINFLKNEVMEVNIASLTGIMTLKVTTSEPTLSADLANAFVVELDLINRKYASAKAGESKNFIQERLMGTDSLLVLAEEKLKIFRETNKRIENSPDLQLQLGGFMREVKIQEEVYLTLKKEFEIARIEEVKNIPLIRILSSAVPPLYKEWPQRTKSAILMIFMAAFISIGIAYLMEYAQALRSKGSVNNLINLTTNTLKQDFDGFKRIFNKNR